MPSRSYAVIGLGQFGRAVALNLAQRDLAVLAIDLDLDRVQAVSGEVDAAVSLDATDAQALGELELDRMSGVVVAIGPKATEGSILTTALLGQLGVKHIVARAFNPLHARVLRAVGAHEVVNPEDEMGRRIAAHLAEPGILDRLPLGDATIAEIEAPQSLVGKTLGELDLRRRRSVTLLAIRRGDEIHPNPGADDQIGAGDLLVVFGGGEAVSKLAGLQ